MFKFKERLGELRGPAGINKKGQPLKEYIPIEEVADEGAFNEDVLDEKNMPEEREPEFSSDDHMIEKQNMNEKIIAKKINFKKGDGVAHIGPGFEKEIESQEQGVPPEEIGNPVSVSMIRSVKGVGDFWSLNKFMRDKKAKGHDNLKTMSDSKKAKNFKQKIIKFFEGQNN